MSVRFGTLFLLGVWLLPAQSTGIQAGLATGSYFPLDVGDRWVYRIDDRAITAAYEIWRIDRIDRMNGVSYSVMVIEDQGTVSGESWFRADGSGKIYVLTGNGEQLFLDPGTPQSSTAELQITGRVTYANSGLGPFQDAIYYQNSTMSLSFETGTLARGIGLLTSTTNVLAGSSGGFGMGRTLVEATVAGIRFPAAAAAIDLGMESLDLDVSGQKVTNCAIPCYFVACGIAGADPTGTYKPCAQARIGLENWPDGRSRTVQLQLTAPDGSTAFSKSLTLSSAGLMFYQVPLYSAPNVPLVAGTYQLSAATADGSGQAAVAVKIK